MAEDSRLPMKNNCLLVATTDSLLFGSLVACNNTCTFPSTSGCESQLVRIQNVDISMVSRNVNPGDCAGLPGQSEWENDNGKKWQNVDPMTHVTSNHSWCRLWWWMWIANIVGRLVGWLVGFVGCYSRLDSCLFSLVVGTVGWVVGWLVSFRCLVSMSECNLMQIQSKIEI